MICLLAHESYEDHGDDDADDDVWPSKGGPSAGA